MKINILGGGITGLFTAYYLLKDGHEVTVVDRCATPKTSINNAGQIAGSSGISTSIGLSRILSRYVGRMGPVYISPFEVLKNIGWFQLALRTNMRRSYEAIEKFSRLSLELYNQFLSQEAISVDLVRGSMSLYENPLKAKEAARRLRGRLVDQAQVSKMGLIGYSNGVMFDNDLYVHPSKLVAELQGLVLKLGGRIRYEGTAELRTTTKGTASLSVNGEELVGEVYVVTSGSWSSEVCKGIGYNPYVIPARGLVLTLDTGGNRVVEGGAFLEDDGIDVVQINRDTLRVASFFEIVGFSENISRSRKKWLLETVARHLVMSHELRLNSIQEGIGFRPCTPDQIPAIGRVPNHEDIYIATGNGRLGVTLAPATARMLASIISGENVSELCESFNPSRFS